jgi:hypothetical protein
MSLNALYGSELHIILDYLLNIHGIKPILSLHLKDILLYNLTICYFRLVTNTVLQKLFDGVFDDQLLKNQWLEPKLDYLKLYPS